MLNKAIKTMETIRKAEETRAAMINEALNTLDVLGYDGATEQSRITIKRGHIVEVQTVKEVVIDNTDYETIEKLTAENEQLKEELAALKQAKEEQNNIMKEADSMAQPKAQPKKAMPAFLQQVMKAEQQKKDNAEKDIVKEALGTEEVVEETNEYTINFKQVVRDEKVNDYSATMFEICGEITIDKTYKFKATNNYYMPIIYGCFDEQVALQSRRIIADKVDRFNLYSERTTNDVNFKYAQDKEYPIVVWRLTEDNGNVVYHAYAKLMNHQIITLTWDKNQLKHILKAGVKSLSLDGSKRTPWRKLDNETLANKFMAVCADIWSEDFTTEKETQNTNEIVVDFTEDPTAGSESLDI